MFFRDLKPKTGVKLDVTLANVRLPIRLGHRDAEKLFVAPLEQQLAAAGLGSVTGMDTGKRYENEITGVDIFLGLTDAARPALNTVAGMLGQLGAPYGSSIRIADVPGDPLIFGVHEGLEVSVGAQDAPDAMHRALLAQTCWEAIENNSVSRGWANRADRTLFYFYGENFHEMKDRLQDLFEEDPRFSKAALRRLA